jgi:CubicO group peptidase (beta-lactamase class C family)
MRQARPLAAILAAFALLSIAPAWAAPAPIAQDPDLDAFIQAQMQEAGIAGLGAAILVDHEVVWMHGYGEADRARHVPFTPATVMNVGSITKTVTGVALMRAVQAGKLDLDADIDGYLPFAVANPAFPDAPITLRQLATHTSGITDRWAVYERAYHYGGDATEPLAAFLQGYFVPGGADYAKDNFLAVAPGTHREYSNIGAALAGYIVERATGERLDALTQREVFAPLGMRDTRWFLEGMDRDRHSTLYVAHNGFTVPIPPYGLVTYPDGGLRTSVADLSRLLAALLNGGELDGARILDADTVAEMQRFHFTAGHTPDNVDPAEKNSGIFWQTKFGGTVMGHGGNDPGLQAEMEASLDRRIGVVLLSNTSLSGEDGKVFVAVFKKLWERAEAIRAQTRAE